MPTVDVPITPEVLSWAIDESGYDEQDVAVALDVSVDEVHAWEQPDSSPILSLTQARRLATFLHRTVAFFLLPTAPRGAALGVQFRHLPGADSRDALNPDERRYLRKAHRLQRVLAWVADELNEPPPRLQRATLDDPPGDGAARMRARLEISPRVQLEWSSSAVAFDRWRDRLEDLGLLVFQYPIGRESCRGFSIWHDRAPLIAVNTAWNEEARIFTLFHELGHLITRTNSACGEGAGQAPRSVRWDPAERWCEQFAAAVLLPGDAVRSVLSASPKGAGRVADVSGVRWLASRFKTSLRATTIRLIELGLASWDLYDQLPAAADAKRGGGGGGGGRVLREIREDQLGRRTTTLFHRAVDADVMSRTQALAYLDVADPDFEQLAVR